MITRYLSRFPTAWLVALPLLASCSSPPNEGPLDDEKVAIALAKLSWQRIYEKTRSPAYSKESTGKFEPYTAELKDGLWTIRATIPEGYRGEALETLIRQQDWKVAVKVIQVDPCIMAPCQIPSSRSVHC